MTAPTEASGEWQWMPKNPPLDMMKAVFLMPLLSEKQVRAMYAELLAAAPKPPAAALDPRMPDEWRVEVSTHGQQVVAIGNAMLAGRDLQEGDRDVITGCAQHLLSFVGYGMPPTLFNPDDEAAAPAPSPEGWREIASAPNLERVLVWSAGRIITARKYVGGNPVYAWAEDEGGVIALPTHWMPMPPPPGAAKEIPND